VKELGLHLVGVSFHVGRVTNQFPTPSLSCV
jgi:hypothetical protein